MTVVDVGAHIGFFALGAALRAGPTGKVYAFEPSPETADLLERHVHMNGFDGLVEVLRIGLSDREGEAAFYAHGETMAAAMFPENIALLSPEELGSPPRNIGSERRRSTSSAANDRSRPIASRSTSREPSSPCSRARRRSSAATLKSSVRCILQLSSSCRAPLARLRVFSATEGRELATDRCAEPTRHLPRSQQPRARALA